MTFCPRNPPRHTGALFSTSSEGSGASRGGPPRPRASPLDAGSLIGLPASSFVDTAHARAAGSHLPAGLARHPSPRKTRYPALIVPLVTSAHCAGRRHVVGHYLEIGRAGRITPSNAA